VAGIVGRRSLTLADIENHARFSYALLKQRFGGLNAVLKSATLSEKNFHRNVSDEDLLRELARIWDLALTHEGRRPYKDDLVKYKSRFSQGPYYRRWGSWIKACEPLLDWDANSSNPVTRHVTASEKPALRSPHRKRAIPLRIRYAILLRDRFTCQLCGRSPSADRGVVVNVDHILPESKGGTLDPSNLRCVCEDCNLGKGNIVEW
jgi:hypothetical protein